MNGLIHSKKNRLKIDIPDKKSQIIFKKLAKICWKLMFFYPESDLGENSEATKLKISVAPLNLQT